MKRTIIFQNEHMNMVIVFFPFRMFLCFLVDYTNHPPMTQPFPCSESGRPGRPWDFWGDHFFKTYN